MKSKIHEYQNKYLAMSKISQNQYSQEQSHQHF